MECYTLCFSDQLQGFGKGPLRSLRCLYRYLEQMEQLDAIGSRAEAA